MINGGRWYWTNLKGRGAKIGWVTLMLGKAGLLAWALLVLMTSAANAHSPFLDVEGLRTWLGPDGRRYQVGMLYGDGILGPDPGRAVILDDHAKIVAVGPRSDDGYAVCYSEHDCIVILSRFPLSKAVPDTATFQTPRDLDFYPEFEKETYGFGHQWLSPMDYAVALTVPIRRDVLGATAMVVLLVTLTFVLIRLARWFEKQPQRSWRRSVFLVFLFPMVAALMFYSLFLLMFLNGFYLLYAAMSSVLAYKMISVVIDRSKSAL